MTNLTSSNKLLHSFPTPHMGWHWCLLNIKKTQQINQSARCLNSANKEVTPRTWIAQVWPPPPPRALLGPNAGGSGPAIGHPGPAYRHPCPRPPSRVLPGLARRSPRSSRFPGNQRAAGRLRSSKRGQGAYTPDATAAWPARCPRDIRTIQAEEDDQGHRPA